MKPKSANINKLLIASAVSTALLSNTVLSQSDQLTLEEVIVTAQKRAQNLQDVPVSITALSTEKMEATGVLQLESLSHGISGLVINNANSLLLPFIRGVGAFNAGAASPSSVAIYIDGLYTPRANAAAFELANVEQIEVLKGPQSTLYGRNATGGVITLTTATPSPEDETSGRIKLSYGNHNQQRLSAYVAGGMSDTVAGSIAASVSKRDGFIENLVTTPNPGGLRGTTDDVNSLDEVSVVAKLAFNPSDNLDITLSASFREFDDTSNFAYKQLNPGFAGLFGASILPERQTFAHWGYREGDDTAINLTARYDFDDMYLVSISGYINNYLSANTETYALPLDFAGFEVDWETTSISQEIRLHSDNDSDLQWMVGAQYFQEGDDASEIWGTIGTVVGVMLNPGTPLGVSPTRDHPLGDTDWDSTSYAVFGEVVYSATDRLNVTLGLRNTREEFDLRDNRDPGFFGAIGFVGVPVADSSEDWNELTYRLVLDYSYDWGMLYLSRSKGFVSGLLNVQNPFGSVIEPEILEATEVGFKSDLMDGRVRLNGAAFIYDYEDIHAQTVNGATGLTNLVSGQEASISGAELDMTAALSESLILTAGITQLFDREYDLFDIPAGAGGFPPVLATGNTIAGAPKSSVTLGLAHEMDIASGSLSSNLSASYNSGVFYDIEESIGSGGLTDDSFTLVNFSATYYSADDNWSLGIWANNLLDEYYITGGINSAGSIVGVENPPRMFGVSAGYSF